MLNFRNKNCNTRKDSETNNCSSLHPNPVLHVPDKTQVCITLEGLLGSVCNTKTHHAILDIAGTATLKFVFHMRVMLFRYLSQSCLYTGPKEPQNVLSLIQNKLKTVLQGCP